MDQGCFWLGKKDTQGFLSVDPQNQFASPYMAMGNNPVVMVDPDGELAFAAAALVVAKAAAIGAAIAGAGYTASEAFSDGGFDSWNWGRFGQSIAMGAVSGAVTFGVGSAFGGASGVVAELGRAAAHGLVNTGVSAAFGNDVSLGTFGVAAASSLMGSGLSNAPKAAQIAGSAVTGGAAAELSGGDFWRGAATGATVAGLNHAAHAGVEWIKDYSLRRRLKKDGLIPLDMSDPTKAYRHAIEGIRIMKLYLDKPEFFRDMIDGPLTMGDVYNFSTMTASSGWITKGGNGIKYYFFNNVPGIKITFQNSVPGITDVDLTHLNKYEYTQDLAVGLRRELIMLIPDIMTG